MKEQLLDYEHSMMLKELGMNEETLAYTHYGGGKNAFFIDHSTEKYNGRKSGDFVAHPLWKQAEQWLWENHRFVFDIWMKGNSFYTEARTPENSRDVICQSDYFDSPIAARQDGIKRAIEYLHKNKTK